ncbi:MULTISPECIES: alpha/beta fold hydrolase [Pseudonocardia]|uniref:AB hydrolase-1 domain-containing protein n=2 Tax=Pseudonocardia TaxID=1847 RepID=A0ABQ0S5M9_9PSEU|nr:MULTISPECIES: alpha/beta fold hydrolase [Pseudonocardia]OSY43949.1 putative hydrolase [Pseudonocardia autotrophica]TDN74318.1 pimeloyl-ACP methyl ester carboxylesterase [Pseudonocardia autotrophica]BBG05082.1 hypothetical protein Pdca_62910 [Pseudonocardia autotrophica]GEC28221.1 hypothetical protein PSA01_52500 [Pseudonocardia saturnea]
MNGTADTAGTLTDAVLDLAGARIHFDVRGTGPLLVLVGSPMGADGFAATAGLLAADHTVVTFDPRGTGRSPVDDADAGSPVAVRAADLAALVEHLGQGPATLVGSSGGAVVALALLQTRPELVRAVVAHEPPLQELLPDAAARRATGDEIVRRYREQGAAAAWALFMAAANLPGGPPEGPGDGVRPESPRGPGLPTVLSLPIAPTGPTAPLVCTARGPGCPARTARARTGNARTPTSGTSSCTRCARRSAGCPIPAPCAAAG